MIRLYIKKGITIGSIFSLLVIGVSSLVYCNSHLYIINHSILDITCPSTHKSLNGEYYFSSFERTDFSRRFILCYFRIKYENIEGSLGIRAKFLRENEILDVVGSLYRRKGTRDFHFNETIAIFRIPYGTDKVFIGIKWQITRGVFYIDEDSVFIEYRTEVGEKPLENSDSCCFSNARASPRKF